VVIAVVALLIGILLPALGQARRTARTSVCTSNMRQYVTAVSTFAVDNNDAIANFDDRFKLNQSTTPQQSWRLHALAILANLTGEPFITAPTGWVPNFRYSYLAMVDYYSGKAPEFAVICPEDRPQYDAIDIPLEDWLNDPNRRFQAVRRYESSYEQSPFSFSYDSGPRAVSEANFVNSIQIQGAGFRQRKLSDVVFPGSKVLSMDQYDRHFARPDDPFHDTTLPGFGGENALYYAVENAKQPLGFFDASVRVKQTAEANPGVDPRDPDDPEPQRLLYGHPSPNKFFVAGWYRWTRGGFQGIDFGGKEINTGQF